MIKGTVYAEDRVGNADRRFGSANQWTLAYFVEEGMHPAPLLLSDDQIAVAKARALANPEDLLPYAGEREENGRAFAAAIGIVAFLIGIGAGLTL